MRTKEKTELETKFEPTTKPEPTRTRIDNNALVLNGLIGIAILCILGSIGVFLAEDTDSAKNVLAVIFQPVPIIVAGLIGFLTATAP